MDAIANPFLHWLLSMSEDQDRVWRRRARERLLWPVCRGKDVAAAPLDQLAVELMHAFADAHRLRMSEILSLLDSPRALALEALAHWAFRTESTATRFPSSDTVRRAG